MTSSISPPIRSANHPADIDNAEHDRPKGVTIDEGIHALFQLIQSDDYDVFGKANELLKNADLLNAVKSLGSPIVGEAAAQGNVGVLSAVLEKMPTEIEAPDEDGMTPILRASKEGQTGAVDLLIAGHAELSKTDNEGNTSLMWAALSGFLDIVKMLLVSWPPTGPDEPKGIDAKNKEGKNSLMFAAEGGHRDIVKLLIENQADLYARDNTGRPALYYAIAGGHEDIVKDFIKAGISLQHFGADLYFEMTLHKNVTREMLLEMIDPTARYDENNQSSA